MNIIPFNYYSVLTHLKSGWATVTNNKLSEGIRLIGSSIDVDFQSDKEGDIVKLNPPTTINPVRKEGIPTYRGYYIEKSDDRGRFMKLVKQWGAVDINNLKALIDLNFPNELLKKKVEIIFITGSSDPLAANIAKAIQELYYPDCKIIDITKKYYGNDINSIIDWEKYEKSDPTTKAMIDAYLKQFKYGKTLADTPDEWFEGYIKKSSGIQSGARRLLKAGHTVDDYIISNIIDSEEKWRSEYMSNPNVNPAAKLQYRPNYLIVDDTIIEGSTLKGIFKTVLDTLDSSLIKSKIGELAQRSIYGYCLFSAKK